MKIRKFSQYKNNASRFRTIVTILHKYGFAHWIKDSDPEFTKALISTTEQQESKRASLPIRLRMAFIELGTTFIKLGQLLSTRADLIGPEIAHELSKLQSEVPADDQDYVIQCLEQELGAPISTLFAEFDFTPLGSASIGQVHLARLHTGEEVVVKLQHQGIADTIKADLEILALLANLAEKYESNLRLYQPKRLVNDFSRALLGELDYARELRSMELFRQHFRHNNRVKIPVTWRQYSTARVLCMERLNGFSIGDTNRMKDCAYNSKAIFHTGINMYLDMIFRDQLFHADPHPGNLWLLDGGVIGLLDYGMVVRLTRQDSTLVEKILLAAVDKDAEEVSHYVLQLCQGHSQLDSDSFQLDIEDFIHNYFSLSLSELDTSAVITRFTDIVRKHHLIIPSSVSMLLRVLLMLDGTSRSLEQHISLAEAIQPYLQRLQRQRLSPKRLSNKLTKSALAWEQTLTLIPRFLDKALHKINDGTVEVNLQHRHLDAVVNRLVYGLLSGSTFLGGCLVLSNSIPPLLNGASIIGLVMIGTGTGLGFKLLRAVNASGKLYQRSRSS
ncbi:ABC1 kinase family protein [Vibrio variabilis]|uniref:ABC1 kinase family protein n=1 Tax=Vibrio variabilis TaxID=990271 RepID=UPI000DD6FDB2|nr:AarF/UbiB family protein [Vibrio variabilis]